MKESKTTDEGTGGKMNKQFIACGNLRPRRKILCQLPKGHKGSCMAVIFWEKEK